MSERYTGGVAVSRHRAAKLLSLGLSSIDKLIKSGDLPSWLEGRKRMISVAGIHEYERRKLAEATAAA